MTDDDSAEGQNHRGHKQGAKVSEKPIKTVQMLKEQKAVRRLLLKVNYSFSLIGENVLIDFQNLK